MPRKYNMMNKHPFLYWFFVSLFIIMMIIPFASCKRKYTPRPHGYFRIDLPKKKYVTYQGPCPFTFEYPVYAIVKKDVEPGAEPCWLNIDFPKFHGMIHFTYKKIQNNLGQMLEDTYSLAYKHTVKADAIREHSFTDKKKHVFGILYDIQGNAASNIQFYLTDSTNNFVRGALYFNLVPDQDSLAPVIQFVKKDIVHLIETFSWK